MHLTNEIKSALAELGIKPNKRLGQNFLLTQSTYEKIVGALDLGRGEIVLEVGPGLGTLTKYLASTDNTVLAVEKDKKLFEYLIKKFAETRKIKLIEGDILKFVPGNYDLVEHGYKLVGNIPYYLTARLLRTVFESWPTPKSIVFMMQLEVAQKLIAKPPHMTLLGVSVQYYSKPKIVARVAAGNFYPPPDVDSAIVQFTPHERGIINKTSAQNFFKVVTTGFGQKRKQLINNLPKALDMSRTEVERALKALVIDPRTRAEALTLEQWQKLTELLYLQS